MTENATVEPHRPINKRQEMALREADEALERISNRKRMDWIDWVRVGEGLSVGRTLALLWSNSNQPSGRRYAETFAAFMAERKLCPPRINKDDRAALLKIMDRKGEVTAWRARLPDAVQYDLNNPRVVWAAFKRHADQAAEFVNGERPDGKRSVESAASLREKISIAEDEGRQGRGHVRALRAELARARAENGVRAKALSCLWDHLHNRGIDAPVGEAEVRNQIAAAVREIPIEDDEAAIL